MSLYRSCIAFHCNIRPEEEIKPVKITRVLSNRMAEKPSTDQFRPLTKAEEEMVHDVWYGDRAKFGRAKSYQLVKAKYGEEFTGSQRAVMAWLKQQPTHQKFNRGLRRTTVKSYGNQ